MEITVERCKHCGQGFSFDSENVYRFRVEAAPLVLVYVVDCPACQKQNILDREQSVEDYLEETRNDDAPEGFQRCPDCAELIMEDARVCRFCGYRLAPAPRAGREE